MKNLIAALVIGLISTLAHAQNSKWFETTKPVLCGPPSELITSLAEKYQEYPIFVAQDSKNDSKYGLFVNKTSGTWTMIQIGKEIACIIGLGDGAQVLNYTKPQI